MTRRSLALALAAAFACLPIVASAQRYTAVLTENGRSSPAGIVRMDASGRLSIVSAPPARAAWLRQMVDEVNAESVLHLDRAPPPGAPRSAYVTTPVPRGDERFLEALRLHLRRYYDVTLRSVGGS